MHGPLASLASFDAGPAVFVLPDGPKCPGTALIQLAKENSMSKQSPHATVRGSTRHEFRNANVVGTVPDDERFEVTIRVRRKAELALQQASGCDADVLPAKRHYLTHGEYADLHGADAADIAKIEAFVSGHGLTVLGHDSGRRSVFVSGTAAQYCAMFGITLEQHEHHGGTFRARKGALTIPQELVDIIDGVFGIDDRPAAQPHFRHPRKHEDSAEKGNKLAAKAHADTAVANAPFLPTQLATLYDFPHGDGDGQTVAIIELGGGYRTEDLKAYFKQLGLHAPKVRTVRVDGGKNQPSTAQSADLEVMLDIEVAAALAPAANYVVYFAPNTDKGFLDAVTTAIHDSNNKPSVLSISWGGDEANYTEQSKTAFNQAFQTAAALGITVCCSTGDYGSNNDEADGLSHVTFPAVSPWVLACGGTQLLAQNNAIYSEVVWNEMPEGGATGGGVSTSFAVPSYQASANVPPSANPPGTQYGRGIPDVAGNADAKTGYRIRVDGGDWVVGGTSAVAPLWAALIAIINQKMDNRVGFLNPLLYGSLRSSGVCRDIVSGNNGAYQSRVGWDACTGWGSPNGKALYKALKG
jgi:kumamolisin